MSDPANGAVSEAEGGGIADRVGGRVTEAVAGSWVTRQLGLLLCTAADSPRPMPELVEVALRRNPKRAHLLVSTVLGKHVPTAPQRVHAAAAELGTLVAGLLGGRAPAVLGYAETATGLGHVVAETLRAEYLHSTRRPVAGLAPIAGFEEPHSHASSHLLLPADPDLLSGARPLVLVDDELSTGRTALNTIAALHLCEPRPHYVIAAPADLRSAADQARTVEFAAALGVRLDVVALGCGRVEAPERFAAAAAELIAATPDPPVRTGGGALRRVEPCWPVGVRDGGRHGFGMADVAAARAAARNTAAEVAPGLGGDRVLVLGFEELMYTPLLIALELGRLVRRVRFSATTRTPVLAIDEPGYPIRTALAFPAHDDPADGPGRRFAYNVAPADGGEPFADIVLVVDEPADTVELQGPTGLLAQLAAVAERVHLVVLPSWTP